MIQVLSKTSTDIRCQCIDNIFHYNTLTFHKFPPEIVDLSVLDSKEKQK